MNEASQQGSAQSVPAQPVIVEAELRAEHLKERIYVTFTALAVVLALGSHAESATPGTVGFTLVLTVLGTLLAVFTADLISHLVIHARLPSRRELAHMMWVCIDAFGAVVLPMLFVGLAALKVWSVESALRASMFALLLALAVVGFLAVRRVQMSAALKLLVLVAEVVLGAVVIALEFLVHG